MSRARDLARFYGQAAAIAAGIAGLGAVAAAAWGGPGAPVDFALGCLASFGGALAAGLPLVGAGGLGNSGPWSALGWSTGLRFLGTVALAIVLAVGSGAARGPLLAGVATTYGALLVLETRWALRRWNRPPAG